MSFQLLLLDNVVQDISSERFEVASPLEWMEVPDDTEVECGDVLSGGVFVSPTVDKEALANKINTQLNEYIYSKYDQGTQTSFAALYIGPDSTDEIKAAIESVWTWIKTVLGYYYLAKANILADQPYEFDLTQFDETDPQISLATLLGGS